MKRTVVLLLAGLLLLPAAAWADPLRPDLCYRIRGGNSGWEMALFRRHNPADLASSGDIGPGATWKGCGRPLRAVFNSTSGDLAVTYGGRTLKADTTTDNYKGLYFKKISLAAQAHAENYFGVAVRNIRFNGKTYQDMKIGAGQSAKLDFAKLPYDESFVLTADVSMTDIYYGSSERVKLELVLQNATRKVSFMPAIFRMAE